MSKQTLSKKTEKEVQVVEEIETKVHISKYLLGRPDINGIIKSMLIDKFKDVDTKDGWEERIEKELMRRYE